MLLQHSTYNYTYNSIYQLTQAQEPNSTTRTYNFDPAGNRVTVTNGGTTTYTTNSLNQYSQVDGIAYSYDLNGNLTSDGTNTYTYDYENRLTQAATPSNTSSFTYDAFGRRLTKTVDGILQAKYIYDRENVILDLDSSNNIVAKYIYGPFLDGNV